MTYDFILDVYCDVQDMHALVRCWQVLYHVPGLDNFTNIISIMFVMR